MTEPDLRMCRKWNRWTNRKEFCLAKFHGDNLSGAVTFFGTERPQPSQIEAARQYYLSYVRTQEEADDARQDEQVTGWQGTSFDAGRDQVQGDHTGQGQVARAAAECDRSWVQAKEGKIGIEIP